MALTRDQQIQLLQTAKQKNPNLTADQGKQLLERATQLSVGAQDTGKPEYTPAQRQSIESAIQAGSQVKEPSQVMKTLAQAQEFLQKSPTLPILGSVVGSGLGGIPGGMAGATLATRGQQLLDPREALGGGAAGEALQRGDIQRAVGGTQKQAQEALGTGALEGAFDVATLGAWKFGKPLLKGVAGKQAFKGVFTVPRKLAEDIGFDNAAKKLLDWGIPGGSMDEYIDMSQQVTGSDGVLSTATRKALGAADDVNIDIGVGSEQLTKSLKKATNVNPRIKRETANQIESILSSIQGDEIYKAKPLEVFDAIKNLETTGYSLAKKAARAADPIAPGQQADLYIETADALKDALFNNEVINKSISEQIKDKSTIEALRKISPKLAKEFRNAKNIGDLRSLQAPFVALSKAAKSTIDSELSTFGKAGARLGRPGISDVLGAAAGIIRSPKIVTSAATAPQRIAQAVSPDEIARTLAGMVSPRTGNIDMIRAALSGGLAREANK